MKTLKMLSAMAYWVAIASLSLFASYLFSEGRSYSGIFHSLAYYLPSVAALFVVSLQIDYLDSIVRGKEVDVRARIIDFLHWLLLISINVSMWFSGEITVWWVLTNLVVLAVVGASVGIGLSRKKLVLTAGEKTSAYIFGIVAIGLGVATWFLRSVEMLSAKPHWAVALVVSTAIFCSVWRYVSRGLAREELGMWGHVGFPLMGFLGGAMGAIGGWNNFSYAWWMDTLTSIVATTLVSGFIIHDLGVIRRDYTGYPRSLFLKGIFGCNLLILAAWVHALLLAQPNYAGWVLEHAGFTYNTLVGNGIYAYYYLAYEKNRYRQMH